MARCHSPSWAVPGAERPMETHALRVPIKAAAPTHPEDPLDAGKILLPPQQDPHEPCQTVILGCIHSLLNLHQTNVLGRCILKACNGEPLRPNPHLVLILSVVLLQIQEKRKADG